MWFGETPQKRSTRRVPSILFDCTIVYLQKHPLDVSYFDSAFTKEDPLLTPLDPDFLNNVNQMQFKGFSLTNRNYTLPPSD